MLLLDPPDGDYERDCVMYLRKSKGKAGIARQTRENEEHSRRVRWRIVAVFTDEDTTAFRHILDDSPSKREDYLAMVEFMLADTRPVPLGILGWHADRIHREVAEAKRFVKVCAVGEHPVETPMSGRYDLTTATGRKRFLVDALDAEYEVDHQSERRGSDKRDAVLFGRWLGGPVPFGYRAVRVGDDGPRVLVHHEVYAGLLKDAYMAVLRTGSEIVLAEVARKWNNLGHRRAQAVKLAATRAEDQAGTADAGLWTGSDISRILQYPRYAALMERYGEVVRTNRTDGKAEWPEIVSEDVWRAVCFILRSGKGRKRGPYREMFGSGHYVCGGLGQGGSECRALMGAGQTHNATRNQDGQRPPTKTYRCRKKGPGHVTRHQANVDALVEAVLIARASKPDVRAALRSLQPADVSELHARLLVEEEALAEWEVEARRPGASPRMVAAGAAATEQRVAELRDQIAAATMTTPIISEILQAANFEDLWDSKADDLGWRRAVLDLFVTVVLEPSQRGRPAGFRSTDGYFDVDSVRFEWKPLGSSTESG